MASKKEPEVLNEDLNVVEGTEENTKAPEDDGTVVVKLMKDGYRYKDDVFISVNGKSIKIKRGVPVRISKAHYEALKHSMDQDAATALLIDQAQDEYRNAVNARIL